MTTTDRLKRSTCPSWCQTRHHEWAVEPEGHEGPSWPTVRGNDDSCVEVAVLQDELGDVLLWLDTDGGASLSPEQGRAAARQLLEAASWAEEHAEG